MLRRLYYLFPEKFQVQTVVDELVEKGIDHGRMHSVAKEGVDLEGLPPATARQVSDLGAKLESWFWFGNLVIFFMAVGVSLLAILFNQWLLLLLGVSVSVGTVWLGKHFASKIPKVHLDQFRGALSHGEILLMVDVPAWRVHDIGQVVTHHHPEADLDGVGWTIEALHI